MNQLDKNFGFRVEALMKERKVKPFDFYEAVGIIPQNYYDWKKRGTVPMASTALKVAQYFGVTVEYLLTGNNTNHLQAKVDELQNRLREIGAYIAEMTKLPTSQTEA